MTNQLTKRNIMRKLVFYIALCGLGILHSSSAMAPVARKNADIVITVRVDSIPLSYDWLTERIAAAYAPKTLPEAEDEAADCESPPKVRVVSEFYPVRVPLSVSPEYQSLLEETLSFIRYHEGFAGGKAYYCVAGFKTIGYGHVVKPGESIPDRITRQEADRLLRRDFNKSIKSALEYSPHLTGCRLFAVAHFIFAKGPGNYQRSTLRKIVNNGGDPSEEFLRWCKYHKPDGHLVKSSYSRRIREWEVSMYNRGSVPSDTMEQVIDSTHINDISEI